MARFRGAPSEPKPLRTHIRSTAHVFAAYRDQLLAHGFAPDEVRDLVAIAAHTLVLEIHPLYEMAAEPPMPPTG